MFPDRDAVRKWVIDNLKAKGRGSRRALADFLGVRTEAISRMTAEAPGQRTREVSATELLRMAEFFGVPPPGAIGEIQIDEGHPKIPIMGYVGAGAEVEPEHEQVPPDGFDQVELPFQIDDDVIGFEVRGDSMLPKYDDGVVIVVHREQQRSTGSLIGEEAAVRTYDGHRFLKRIMPGPRPHTFNLESSNARTIVGARIAWASEIVAIIPRGRVRHVGKERQRVVAPHHRAEGKGRR